MLRRLMNLVWDVDLGQLRHWGIKGGFAVLDQGLFSGSNFILNVLLARWLAPAQYGAFAVAFAVYIFLSGFHNALILEPVSVFGTSKHTSDLKLFLATQFLSHFLVTGALGMLVLLFSKGLFAFRLIRTDIYLALIGVGVSLPLLLLIWLARRIYYVMQMPVGAFWTTLTYAILLAGLSYFLYSSRYRENISLWFAVMGLAGFISSINIILRFFSGLTRQAVFSNWLTFFHEQMIFGRWIVLASMLYSVGTQIQVFVVASFLGLQIAGGFRAIQNFMLPMFQILGAVSTLVMPSFAFEFGLGHYRAMQRKSLQVTLLLVGLALSYEVFLFFFGVQLESLLYGGKYSDYVWLIPWIGLVPLINAMETGYSLILRSLQRPSFYMIDKIVVALIGGVTAVVLTKYWMISGAVISLIVIEGSTLLVYWWLNQKWFLKMVGATAS